MDLFYIAGNLGSWKEGKEGRKGGRKRRVKEE